MQIFLEQRYKSFQTNCGKKTGLRALMFLNYKPSLLGILEHSVNEELLVDLPVVDFLFDSSRGHQPERTIKFISII